MATTRTTGPLHFEDLEPKRFEDLVRQLAYDFKPWRKLEATGRAGSDDGFDARGYESVEQRPALDVVAGDEQVEEEGVLVEGAGDRLWLIQCKREKVIGPTALVKYLDDIALGPDEKLHGILFTAAADFSKKARDAFGKKCRVLGLEEWHLWGKAELEDRLFRPDADRLLFAYFGISLTIRRRSQRTEVRSRLAMKRKAHRLLENKEHSFLLLRSPDAQSYPYIADMAVFKRHPPWLVWKFLGFHHDGLRFCIQRHYAYLSDDGKSWDAAFAVNEARPHQYADPWLGGERSSDERERLHEAWAQLPEANRSWLEVTGILRYEDILDIDELGDEYMEEPHIYATFAADPLLGPFTGFRAEVATTEQWGSRSFKPRTKHDGRIEHFAAEFRTDSDEQK